MNETLGYGFIVVGLMFNFFGCLGLVRLPDVYNRLQAASKCVTVGTCGILFGLFLFKGCTAAGLKALMCIGFILLTAPVTAHALARGAYRSGVKPCDQTVSDAYGEDLKKD
ncbi:MAG: monovalent cation/H(+) antiporter subunit G [Candidatus Omnitrophota bacterium]